LVFAKPTTKHFAQPRSPARKASTCLGININGEDRVMKFGIFDYGMWHQSQSQAEVYDSAVSHAEIADELGFEAIWLGEHHFSRHGIYGNSLTLASFIAARTERLRIGTAVVVLPLNNPVRVAEEVAMVDILSNGRVDFGIGAGYQRLEFGGFGIDINESRARFLECLDVIVASWTQEHLSYKGTFYNWDAADELSVEPKPVQSPYPQIYVAISASPETIDLAASRNLRLLVGGPTDIMGIAPQVIARWRAAMEAHGNPHEGIDIPCAKGIYVAPTDEEAEADVAAVDRFWDLKLLAQIGSPISKGGDIPPGYEHWAMRTQDREQSLVKNTTGTEALVGSPDTVAKRLTDLQEMGLTYLFGSFGLPGMPEEKKARAIELFGREVLPRFPDKVRASAAV
jgi:alkanesulfonate monooxygenase SsuD/methylene tetrahydromethanopterin reductase-like flavin-dependent oxidoreductase (luciferase family)